MTSLCQTFQALGALTARRMTAAWSHNLSWSEETNTETLLLELRERHPSSVAVTAFNKRDEAVNGADWEWWFGGRGSWWPMRIQAKRLRRDRPAFTRLQSYQAKSQPMTQIATLIEMARQDRRTPMYCLYTDGSSATAPLDVGCLVGHASKIQKKGKDTLEDLEPVLMPWHWLVCPSAPKASGSGLASFAYASVQRLVERSTEALAGQQDDQTASEDMPLFEPVANLPPDLVGIWDSRGVMGASPNPAAERYCREHQLRGVLVIDDVGAA